MTDVARGSRSPQGYTAIMKDEINAKPKPQTLNPESYTAIVKDELNAKPKPQTLNPEGYTAMMKDELNDMYMKDGARG